MLNIRTSNINWTKMATVFGALIVLWTGLVTLLPPKLYEPVSVVLAAVQSVLLYLMRSGNYVPGRTETTSITGVKP